MRQAYRTLREMKAKAEITGEQFDSMYALFDDLSDSLRQSAPERQAVVQRCIAQAT